jgi:hypothetical protein
MLWDVRTCSWSTCILLMLLKVLLKVIVRMIGEIVILSYLYIGGLELPGIAKLHYVIVSNRMKDARLLFEHNSLDPVCNTVLFLNVRCCKF